jgi:chromosome segregation ATPase
MSPRCSHSVVAALVFAGAAAAAGDPKVPCYTNADLDRVSSLRGQTGVLSEVAAPTAADRKAEKEEEREEHHRSKAERTWRQAARRHRAQVRRLEKRLAALQRRKDAYERRRRTQMMKGKIPDPPSKDFDTQIAELQEEIRQSESDFLDRARRDGALPGWLR